LELTKIALPTNGGFMIKKCPEQHKQKQHKQVGAKIGSDLSLLYVPTLPTSLLPEHDLALVTDDAIAKSKHGAPALAILNQDAEPIAKEMFESESDRNLSKSQPKSTELRQIFAAVSPKSCPGSLNFHLHTVFSDGRMQPEDIVNQAIASQVCHFAITDHHTVEGYLIANRMLQRLKQQQSDPSNSFPKIWVGVEINASLMFNEVHILGYGFDPDHEAMQAYLQGHTTAGLDYQCTSVIKSIHLAGGLAILAHPARYRRSAEDLVPAAVSLGIDGVETYYGYDHCDPWYPSPKQLAIVKHLGDSYGLLHTCGTDSHGLKISRRL
jgi:predicted metal-dependent phosphoesterase TrpH